MHSLNFYAMGTEMSVWLDTQDAPTAHALLAQVPQWFAAWEQTFSRFRSDSELSRVNAQSGFWIHVGVDFWDVLHMAISAAQSSDGMLNPLVHQALLQAGYTENFTDLAQEQVLAHKMIVKVPDISEIQLNENTREVCIPNGTGLDLGGFVKGWCADKAVERLAKFAPTMMDAGGDIAISGLMRDDSEWEVALAQPRVQSNAEEDLAVLALGQCGVATSGCDYRQWTQNGQARHHLIDPRTAQSAQTDVLTATVIAPTTQRAEAVAKVLLILGSTQAQVYLSKQKDCMACLVLDDGAVWMDERFMGRVLPELVGNVPSENIDNSGRNT